MFLESAKNFLSYELQSENFYEQKYLFHLRLKVGFILQKKRNGLLDKSSLFDPWIHPLNAKKRSVHFEI
jgi:hypothetical protein